MQTIGPYLVGMAFWLFIGAVAVAGIVTDYKRRRGKVDLLRLAIEKGQQLDPAIIEKLTSDGHRDDSTDPMDLKLGGIIVIASGVGIIVLGSFVSSVVHEYILGGGFLTVCVGVGLLVAAKVLSKAQNRERSRSNVP